MKKYALVGTGGRAGLYIEAISGKWKDNAQLVAFCDTNQTRMNYANTLLSHAGSPPASTWKAADFDTMIHETRRILSSSPPWTARTTSTLCGRCMPVAM